MISEKRLILTRWYFIDEHWLCFYTDDSVILQSKKETTIPKRHSPTLATLEFLTKLMNWITSAPLWCLSHCRQSLFTHSYFQPKISYNQADKWKAKAKIKAFYSVTFYCSGRIHILPPCGRKHPPSRVLLCGWTCAWLEVSERDFPHWESTEY